MADIYRYKAFISYSHSDKAAADRLLKDIEGYRVPQRLVGKATANGTAVPGRVGHIFRDRDELPAAEDLTAEVKKALTQSEFMIVLCSPAAAASRWVNREIIEFKKLTGERRILSVILSGEPFASAGDAPEQECFPPALRFKLGPSGTLTTKPAEPLAADFREAGDGQRRGKLKLVAGLLGIGLDALIERDLQRKMRRVMVVTAASVLAMIGMASLTYEAVTARQDAERHRGEAEGLIEFMLTDLRDKLEPVGRLDVLDAVGEKAVDYYDRQELGDMPDDALGRRARAFHLLGEIDDKQGDLKGAQEKFETAYQATAAQLAKDPDNPDRIYDHSQSAYWIGYVYWQRGEYTSTEKAFREYKSLAEFLVAHHPGNLRWTAERAYANSNLGTFLMQQEREPENASIFFEIAQEGFLKIAEKSPKNISAKLDLADAYGWLADTYHVFRPLLDAVALREKQIDLYHDIHQQDTENMLANTELLNSQTSLAHLQLDIGNLEKALNLFKIVAKAWNQYLMRDATNETWLNLSTIANLQYADALLQIRSFAEFDIIMENIFGTTFNSKKKGEQSLQRQVQLVFRAQFLVAKKYYMLGLYDKAYSITETLAKAIDGEKEAIIATKQGPYIFASAYLLNGMTLERLGRDQEAIETWNKAVLHDNALAINFPPEARALFAQIYRRIGQTQNEKQLVNSLKKQGYAISKSETSNSKI